MEVIGSIYTEVSDRFQRGIFPIARCVKAENHDLGVVLMEQIILDGSQRGFENGKWRTYTDIMPSITAREYKEPRSVMEVLQIGNIAEEKNFKNPQTGRIYDVGGCSPTLSTMQGGNQEPKILVEQIPCKLNKMPDGHLDSLDNAKICDVDTPTASTVTSRYYKGIGAHKDNMCLVRQLGFMDNGTGKHQSNTVYSENGLSPNITTIEGGGTQQIKIAESQIVAMRGRNPDNPSDRSVGSPTEQRLEPNMSGTSNCLTSVQKDNLVLESNVLTPKRTEYGKAIRKAYENGEVQESRHNMTELEPRTDGVSNTLTTVQKDNLVMETVRIKQATKDGYIECEVGGCFDASYPESETRRGRVQDNGNTCPTLTAQNQDICRIEKVGKISNDGSQYGTVISDNGLSATLSAGTHGYANSCIQTQYCIRKLTPRECGRLMGVSDEDISKMAEVNSNTQLYKQFGNSIVVDVMCAMFKNLNIKQGD